MRTVPVKYSAGLLLEGCEPHCLMAISILLPFDPLQLQRRMHSMSSTTDGDDVRSRDGVH
jgi:hypothetical protein